MIKGRAANGLLLARLPTSWRVLAKSKVICFGVRALHFPAPVNGMPFSYLPHKNIIIVKMFIASVTFQKEHHDFLVQTSQRKET